MDYEKLKTKFLENVQANADDGDAEESLQWLIALREVMALERESSS